MSSIELTSKMAEVARSYRNTNRAVETLNKQKAELRDQLLGYLEENNADIAVGNGYSLKCTQTKESYYTAEDVKKMEAKVGTVKSKSTKRLKVDPIDVTESHLSEEDSVLQVVSMMGGETPKEDTEETFESAPSKRKRVQRKLAPKSASKTAKKPTKKTGIRKTKVAKKSK